MTEQHQISCADGVTLAGTSFTAAGRLRGAVVIAPALGAPRRVYRALAEFLAANGYACVTFDYRGVGDSRVDPSVRPVFADWGKQDIDAALRVALTQFDPPALMLLGHSCGGQLFGLARHAAHLSGVVLVAATLAHWRLWPGISKLGMLALWYLLVPLVSAGRRRFPARRLGLSSVDVPAGVTAQWASWARRREYLFAPQLGLDLSRYRTFTGPVLALAFDDDRYAPEAAVRALLARLPRARAELRVVDVARLGAGRVGHFGYFREHLRDALWTALLEWLERVEPRAGVSR